MKSILLLLALCCVGTSANLWTDDLVMVSRKYDGLPSPLLNPHALEFLTTHGLHCYYAVVDALPRTDLDWVTKLHLRHCLQEVTEVLRFFQEHKDFSIPELMCPQITGNDKTWLNKAEEHELNYYNGTSTKVTIAELLTKDTDLFGIYSNGSKKLYVNYSHQVPAKLYVNYSHQLPKKKSAATSLGNSYVSDQDTEMRMIAGFNYGVLILKHMLGKPLTEAEGSYLAEQEKSSSERAWAAASFYCTLHSSTSSVLGDLLTKTEDKFV